MSDSLPYSFYDIIIGVYYNENKYYLQNESMVQVIDRIAMNSPRQIVKDCL